MTPAQLLVAWVLAKQRGLVPVLGARKLDQLDAITGALAHPLNADVVAKLEALVPEDAIAGERYAAAQMAMLDSDR